MIRDDIRIMWAFSESAMNGSANNSVTKIIAIFVTLLLALPFMADSLQAHMMRISSRIIGG